LFQHPELSGRLNLAEADPQFQHHHGWKDRTNLHNVHGCVAWLAGVNVRVHAVLLVQLRQQVLQVHMTERHLEPFSDLAPVDIQLLLDSGVPGEAIVGTRLDLQLLASFGWIVDGDAISPPPEGAEADEH
jgi:hypothetical protein